MVLIASRLPFLEIKKLDKELEDKGSELPGHENITSIKGIGKKSGSILLSVIIKAKKGSGKAIIATAKKLLYVIYYTLKENIIFEDFANGVIRTT